MTQHSSPKPIANLTMCLAVLTKPKTNTPDIKKEFEGFKEFEGCTIMMKCELLLAKNLETFLNVLSARMTLKIACQ